MKRLERFTQRARHVLSIAGDEARNYETLEITTAHILLGLMIEGEGVAGRALRELGITISGTRAQISNSSPLIPKNTDKMLRLSHSAESAITRATDEAKQVGHRYVGTEHLLLSIINGTTCTATRALQMMGVSVEDVKDAVMKIIGKKPGQSSAQSVSSETTTGHETVEKATHKQSPKDGPFHVYVDRWPARTILKSIDTAFKFDALGSEPITIYRNWKNAIEVINAIHRDFPRAKISVKFETRYKYVHNQFQKSRPYYMIEGEIDTGFARISAFNLDEKWAVNHITDLIYSRLKELLGNYWEDQLEQPD